MNYNGDTLEDVTANETFSAHIAEDFLTNYEKFVAADYFGFGWEAAMKFIQEAKNGQE